MNESQPKRRRTSQLSSADHGSSLYESSAEVEEVMYAGRVLRMQMVNFMCHANLEINFNSRINFISGRNGSGKSAVMAALVVVLGGTAVNTGRGSGVADFIKKGENSGRVTIELLNEGVNAYKPMMYGERIVIVRSFSRGGTNSYTIKSATGVAISKKKQEVDRICEVLRLEIRNPICVLNQDVARSFLTSSDSKLRYDLFMNATQLRQLEKLHEETITQLTLAKTDLDRKNHLLDEAQKEVEAITKKLKYLSSLEKTTEERRNLESEFLWARVVAEERAVEALKDERKILEEKLEEFNESLANHQTRVDSLEEEANELKQDLDEVMRKKQELAEKKREVNTDLLRSQNEITRQETQLALTLPKLQRTVADIERVKECIQQIDERNNRSTEEHAMVTEKIRLVQVQLKEIQERFVAAERDLDNANETKLRTREELSGASSVVKDLERNRAHKLNQLAGLRGQGDMEALRFGAYVPQLLQAIETASKKNQFKRKPIGPLGMHVTLNCDSKWAAAVESVIGGLMTSFCCDNEQDFRVLSHIMDKVVGKRQPSVIISHFQPQRHNVSRNRVKIPGHSTILDVLSFSDDTVYNTLIDQAGIESILLFERDEQAGAMLTHLENVPKGLRMGVTMACDRYYPAPNYRTYAGRAGVKFFNQSSRREDVISKLEAELQVLETEIGQRLEEQNAHRETLVKIDDFATRSTVRLRELRQKRGALELELSQLSDREESRPIPRTRLALEEELEALENQKCHCEGERDKKQQTVIEMEKSGIKWKQKLQEVNRRIDQYQDEISRIEAELSKNIDAKNAQEFIKKNSDAQRERLQQQVSNNSERQAVAMVELKQCEEEAARICPNRIETTRSLSEISKLLEQKEKYLRAAEKISGTKEEMIAAFRDKSTLCQDKLDNKERIESDIRFFTSSVANRMRLFNEKLRLCAQEVTYYFRASLMTRGYDGMLRFDFDAGQLELEVIPHSSERGSQRTDSKTLSGGERSYSTVSFILAMWRAVVMPFYFLDEFDVFMDKVNRKVVMDLLLQYATEKTNTQFVFITPQDISSVVASDIISIFKMPDPERSRPNDS